MTAQPSETDMERFKATALWIFDHPGGFPGVAQEGCLLPHCRCNKPWETCELIPPRPKRALDAAMIRELLSDNEEGGE